MSTQTPTQDGTVLLTPADVAQLAKVSRETVYREIDRGELVAIHVGRQLRIDPVDLDHGAVTSVIDTWQHPYTGVTITFEDRRPRVKTAEPDVDTLAAFEIIAEAMADTPAHEGRHAAVRDGILGYVQFDSAGEQADRMRLAELAVAPSARRQARPPGRPAQTTAAATRRRSLRSSAGSTSTRSNGTGLSISPARSPATLGQEGRGPDRRDVRTRDYARRSDAQGHPRRRMARDRGPEQAPHPSRD